MAKDIKNTLQNNQSTKPFDQRIPFKNPFFQAKPVAFNKNNSRLVTSFRTQNRSGGGK
jgi:hypothetical protein